MIMLSKPTKLRKVALHARSNLAVKRGELKSLGDGIKFMGIFTIDFESYIGITRLLVPSYRIFL